MRPPGGPHIDPLEKLTVLLVDDCADTREMLRSFLETMGFRVEEADGVARAVAVLESGARVTCVLTDFHMPAGSGLELVAILRSRWASVPVVVVSGDGEVAALALESGATGFPCKPCGPSELAAALRRIVGWPRGRG